MMIPDLCSGTSVLLQRRYSLNSTVYLPFSDRAHAWRRIRWSRDVSIRIPTQEGLKDEKMHHCELSFLRILWFLLRSLFPHPNQIKTKEAEVWYSGVWYPVLNMWVAWSRLFVAFLLCRWDQRWIFIRYVGISYGMVYLLLAINLRTVCSHVCGTSKTAERSGWDSMCTRVYSDAGRADNRGNMIGFGQLVEEIPKGR